MQASSVLYTKPKQISKLQVLILSVRIHFIFVLIKELQVDLALNV